MLYQRPAVEQRFREGVRVAAKAGGAILRSASGDDAAANGSGAGGISGFAVN